MKDIREEAERFSLYLQQLGYVKVVHGKWLPREANVLYPFWERYTCSECGKHSDDTRYCPNCGAKMDGEE